MGVGELGRICCSVYEGPDYRRDMFDWIAAKVPPSATLLIESDTMPLLQIAYDRADRESVFQDGMKQAFEKLHPRFVRRITKCQFIAAVYNYDPKLIASRDAFFLASSQNREFIDRNRAALPEPAAFYAALDARATIVHESGGIHEKLVLYSMTPSSRPASRERLRRPGSRTGG